MLLRHTLLLAHFAGVMMLVAGVGASVACKSAALRSSSPRSIYELLITASRAVHKVAMPGSLLLLLAGGALVGISHGRFSMADTWIVSAIVLWIGSALVGIKLHGPRSRAAREVALQLADSGASASSELHDLIRRGRAATYLDLAMLGGMVALMVFKPEL